MIDHLGRADDQVKVKGFRVELDGVSAAMEVRSVAPVFRPTLNISADLLTSQCRSRSLDWT